MRYLRRIRRAVSGVPEMSVEARSYVGDDPSYSYAVVIDGGPGHDYGVYDVAELFLENVDEHAEGESRIADARVIVRLWFEETHMDFLYSDVFSHLEKARTLLLEGEMSAPPE